MIYSKGHRGIESIFNECVKEAIQMGRKYMKDEIFLEENQPTQQEWELALILFNHRISGGES